MSAYRRVIAALAEQENWRKVWAFDGRKNIYAAELFLPQHEISFEVLCHPVVYTLCLLQSTPGEKCHACNCMYMHVIVSILHPCELRRGTCIIAEHAEGVVRQCSGLHVLSTESVAFRSRRRMQTQAAKGISTWSSSGRKLSTSLPSSRSSGVLLFTSASSG